MNFQAKISVHFHYQIPKYAWNSFLKRMFDPLCSEEEITTYLNIHVQRQIWLLVIFVSRTPYFIFSHLHTSIFSSDVIRAHVRCAGNSLTALMKPQSIPQKGLYDHHKLLIMVKKSRRYTNIWNVVLNKKPG